MEFVCESSIRKLLRLEFPCCVIMFCLCAGDWNGLYAQEESSSKFRYLLRTI